jgi:hypothetical protein
MPGKGWSRPFDDPIALPDGRELVTLKDAGNYITKLPKAKHEAPEWQAAMQALILVATKGGPTMLARIGIMRALNRHAERVFDPLRARTIIGAPQAQEGPMTVFVYINPEKEVGDIDYIRVFANREAAERWFEENDPEGVAFENDMKFWSERICSAHYLSLPEPKFRAPIVTRVLGVIARPPPMPRPQAIHPQEPLSDASPGGGLLCRHAVGRRVRTCDLFRFTYRDPAGLVALPTGTEFLFVRSAVAYQRPTGLIELVRCWVVPKNRAATSVSFPRALQHVQCHPPD